MGEDAIELVDRVIERLDDALAAAGFAPLAPAPDPEAVAEVERAIAPDALPEDLRRFWERVDFWSLSARSSRLPDPRDAGTALETHRQNLEEFPLLFGPPLLFPIARISGDQWSIELVSRWSTGGTVFSVETGPVVFRIEYASFSDLLEVHAELIEEGHVERRWDDGRRGSLSHEHERAKGEARLAAAGPHPVYGEVREIEARPELWPAHWLEAAGIDLSDRAPLGATHTIRELIAESQQRSTEGRIRGKVERLGGSSDGVLALVSDGDSAVLVYCPAAAMTWGPSSGGRYEFDVVVPERAAPAEEAVSPQLFDGHSPAAVARAVRPLD